MKNKAVENLLTIRFVGQKVKIVERKVMLAEIVRNLLRKGTFAERMQKNV